MRPCEQCGELFCVNSFGRPRRYCSAACRDHASYLRCKVQRDVVRRMAILARRRDARGAEASSSPGTNATTI